jgi:hypothetical protein
MRGLGVRGAKAEAVRRALPAAPSTPSASKVPASAGPGSGETPDTVRDPPRTERMR